MAIRHLLLLPTKKVADIALPAVDLLAQWYAGNGSVVHNSVTTTGDGAPVTQWDDLSPNNRDVSQGTVANQPTYHKSVAAFNNRGSVEFDGDDLLQRTIAAGILANLNIYTLFTVWLDDVGNDYVYSENNSGDNTPVVAQNIAAGETLNAIHNDDAGVSGTVNGGAGLADSVAHIVTQRRLAADSFVLRIDGVQVGVSANMPGVATIDTVTLGALGRGVPIRFFTGQIALVTSYGADNFATVEPIIAAHYGITLP